VRAAFESSRQQVELLFSPTTILRCSSSYVSERLSNFPVRIEYVSGLNLIKRIKDILQRQLKGK